MIDVKNLYLIEKHNAVKIFLYAGMLLAYLGSLNPWFLWPLGQLYVIPACALLIVAMLISNTMESPIFSRRDFFIEMLVYVTLAFYQLFVNNGNVNGYIAQTFCIFIFLALFRLSPKRLLELTAFLAKSMAVILIVSIPFYLLYLAGFSLPSRNAVFGSDALYSYTNYYFFMIDDRTLSPIFFPRFHAVFLEPGHLGTATVLLLLAQMGMWKKWYNVVLIITTLMTFSLAAYVLFVIIVILNSWVQRKHILKKAMIITTCLATITIGSFFYNNGENLIHDLILIRLEIDDGEMSGDNRVTEDFQTEYDSFLESSDIFFGREMDKSTAGNSGFRVYIYDYGLIGLLLVAAFYLIAFSKAKDKRMWSAAMIISVLCFIVRGYPLWFNYFIPLLCAACRNNTIITNKAIAENECSIHS